MVFKSSGCVSEAPVFILLTKVLVSCRWEEDVE